MSFDQQMSSDGRGEIKIGEVEDYGPGVPEDDTYFDAFCNPDPLKIKHGEEGNIAIVNSIWSTAAITGIDLPNCYLIIFFL